MKIHQATIDALRDRLDIVELVGEHVVLKKQGQEFGGLCPFHAEKSPSFTVNPVKNVFYCFGCNQGGDAINFLTEIGKQSFQEVVLGLAQRYQIPVQTMEPEHQRQFEREVSERQMLLEILGLAADFFQRQLDVEIRGYLAARHLTPETIQSFGIGYAPAGYKSLYEYLVEEKHKPESLVARAGLIKRGKNDEWIDFFRNRIMIPINNVQGQTIGFGGRALGDAMPKYLNTPQTTLFDKGKTLFALDKAAEAISKVDRAVVVEGYLDAIALHQAGITHAVANLGTSLTPDQYRLLCRYTESKKIVLNFDNDKAGKVAIARALSQVERELGCFQSEPQVLVLPGAKDAAEFLESHSPEAYRELELGAPPWIEWQIKTIVTGRNFTKSGDVNLCTAQMVELLQKIADPSRQLFYLNHCAQLLGAGNPKLPSLYLEALRKKLNSSVPVPAAAVQPEVETLQSQAEILLLQVYLHHPEYREVILDSLDAAGLSFVHYRPIWQLVLTAEPNNHPQHLLQAVAASLPPRLLHLGDKQKADLVRTPLMIERAIASLHQLNLEKERQFCLDKIKSPLSPKDREKYWTQFCNVTQEIQGIQKIRYGTGFELRQVS